VRAVVWHAAGDVRLEEVRAPTDGRGADVAVDAAGAPGSTGTALAATRPGGRSVVVGPNARPEALDLLGLVSGEKTLIGSLSHVWDEDFAKALRLLGDSVLAADDLVTTRLPLGDAVARGFDALAAGRDGIKVQISPRA
jgi:(R,R)-butanediol dehydrogenase/meso-butanediol dehydrogenase/diacetyl reductase